MTAQVVFIVAVVCLLVIYGGKGSAIPPRRSGGPLSATRTTNSGIARTPTVTPDSPATRSPVVDRAPQPADGCPCGGRWTRRENGATGGRFWGCSNFPRCSNTRDEVMRDRYGTHWREIDRPELADRCSNGHVRTPSNTAYNAAGHRVCIDCKAAAAKEASMRAGMAGSKSATRAPLPEAATCRNGHPRTPENTYVRPDGERECRECRRNARRR